MSVVFLLCPPDPYCNSTVQLFSTDVALNNPYKLHKTGRFSYQHVPYDPCSWLVLFLELHACRSVDNLQISSTSCSPAESRENFPLVVIKLRYFASKRSNYFILCNSTCAMGSPSCYTSSQHVETFFFDPKAEFRATSWRLFLLLWFCCCCCHVVWQKQAKTPPQNSAMLTEWFGQL